MTPDWNITVAEPISNDWWKTTKSNPTHIGPTKVAITQNERPNQEIIASTGAISFAQSVEDGPAAASISHQNTNITLT